MAQYLRGGGGVRPPLCDIPSGCCSFMGPWTVTRSSLRMLHRVAAFCRPLRPVLLLGSFPRSRSPVVGVPGLCWMWQDVPFARQRRPVVGVVGLCWLSRGSFDCGSSPPSPSSGAEFLEAPKAPKKIFDRLRARRKFWPNISGAVVVCDPPCVTFRLVVAPLWGSGRSPVLPFACCIGLLLSVGRCGRCSCWGRFRVHGA